MTNGHWPEGHPHDQWCPSAAVRDSSVSNPLDLNRSPRVGIAVAPYHLQAIGAKVEEAIELCGDQLFFFYAWQRQPGMNQLPGHGPANFAPWLKALAKVRYKWFVNPFMHGLVEPETMSAALARSREYLQSLTP